MIKFFTIAFLISAVSMASSIVNAKYTVSKIIKKDGKTLVGFVESATFYQAEGKQLECIQTSTKTQNKIEISYDYKTYKIKTCKVLK